MCPLLAVYQRVCVEEEMSHLQRMYRSSHIRQLEDGGRRLKQRIVELEKEVLLLEFNKNSAKPSAEVIVG